MGEALASPAAPASLDVVPPLLVGLPELPAVSPPCPAELAPPALTSELGRLSLLQALEKPKQSASAAGAAQKRRHLRAIFSVAGRYHAARAAPRRPLNGVGQATGAETAFGQVRSQLFVAFSARFLWLGPYGKWHVACFALG